MKLFKKLGLILILLAVLIVLGLFISYKVLTSPVDKSNKDVIRFEVSENATFYNLMDILYDKELIKSKLVYKIYIKFKKPNNLQVGIYSLNKSMALEEIVDILNGGSTYNPYVKNMTIKEGNNIRKIATIIDEKTDNSYDDVMNKMTDNSFISALIQKYWFLTDDILNSKIYYPLEGYLFPETYQISSKDSVESIITVLLDQMNAKLTPLKEQFSNSKYSIHELITLASVIELEAGNASDRGSVAGVFYNRLKANWSLGSDVTTYYGSKIDDWSYSLTYKELNDCSNGYNTRCTSKKGLPIGPIGNPSYESIKAVLNPTSHSYYYFVADCKGKTYLNIDSKGHSLTISKLKKENNWCA